VIFSLAKIMMNVTITMEDAVTHAVILKEVSSVPVLQVIL